jgi:hypothetical protein
MKKHPYILSVLIFISEPYSKTKGYSLVKDTFRLVRFFKILLEKMYVKLITCKLQQ